MFLAYMESFALTSCCFLPSFQQLLDCFVIPVVILLSWFFLLIRYKAVHFIGIVVCILGMGCMVGADVLVGRHQGAGESPCVQQGTCLCGWGRGKSWNVHCWM